MALGGRPSSTHAAWLGMLSASSRLGCQKAARKGIRKCKKRYRVPHRCVAMVTSFHCDGSGTSQDQIAETEQNNEQSYATDDASTTQARPP